MITMRDDPSVFLRFEKVVVANNEPRVQHRTVNSINRSDRQNIITEQSIDWSGSAVTRTVNTLPNALKR